MQFSASINKLNFLALSATKPHKILIKTTKNKEKALFSGSISLKEKITVNEIIKFFYPQILKLEAEND